jgi:hypothetical protein
MVGTFIKMIYVPMEELQFVVLGMVGEAFTSMMVEALLI